MVSCVVGEGVWLVRSDHKLGGSPAEGPCRHPASRDLGLERRLMGTENHYCILLIFFFFLIQPRRHFSGTGPLPYFSPSERYVIFTFVTPASVRPFLAACRRSGLGGRGSYSSLSPVCDPISSFGKGQVVIVGLEGSRPRRR